MKCQQATLDHFLTSALNNSPLIADYHNQARLNAIDLELVQAAFKPQVNGASNNSYAPVIHGIGYDGAITNGANITALVSVNKTFIGDGNLRAKLETLNIAGRTVANTSKLSEQELRRTIISQYIATYGDLQQLQFAKEIGTLLEKEDTILERLTRQNVYRQTDYLTFLVTVQQQKLAIQQGLIQYHTDYLILNYLCGINDTTVRMLEPPDIHLGQPLTPESSVFYHQYMLDSLKIRNERTVLDYQYKPKLSVFADAGYISSLLTLPYRNFGTSFGFSVAVPIYDGNQRKLQYRKLDIAEQTRMSYRDFFKNQYAMQVSQLLRQVQETEKLIDDIKAQIKYSEGLIQVDLKLLATGDVKIADLVIAINNYLTAKNLLAQNTVNRLQLINQANYWNK